ncbi:MAG: hypothetical protein RBR40_05815 [Tenuifilaceae bacterium]|nr:hypothetical protein [Tenuifilaceae bacterium]
MKNLIIIFFLFSQLAAAQQWTDMSFFELDGCFVRSTSDLTDNMQPKKLGNGRFSAISAVDGNYQTAWVEGVAGHGIGESIFVSMPNNCSVMNILSGYGKSRALFYQNSRPKTVKLRCYVGINPTGYVSEISPIFKIQKYDKEYVLHLADVDSLQSFSFPFHKSQLASFGDSVKEQYFEEFTEPIFQMLYFVEIEIVDVYIGSEYSDTCISEIFFNNSYVPDYRKQNHSSIVDVYVDERNENRLLIDTHGNKSIEVLSRPEAILQLIETSADKRWVILTSTPAFAGEGGDKTEYLLINTHLGKVMNADIERTTGAPLLGPLFIVEKYGTVVIEHLKGEVQVR